DLDVGQLDGGLTTPQHREIFEGGHVWLSSELALQAVEWMELQAMKSGARPRDPAAIDRAFAARMAFVTEGGADKTTYLRLRAIADDFDGLTDVRAIAERASALGRDKAVRAALKQDDDEDVREERMIRDVKVLEARLNAGEDRLGALSDLRRKWKDLSDAAKKPDDSSERRLMRRV